MARQLTPEEHALLQVANAEIDARPHVPLRDLRALTDEQLLLRRQQLEGFLVPFEIESIKGLGSTVRRLEQCHQQIANIDAVAAHREGERARTLALRNFKVDVATLVISVLLALLGLWISWKQLQLAERLGP